MYVQQIFYPHSQNHQILSLAQLWEYYHITSGNYWYPPGGWYNSLVGQSHFLKSCLRSYSHLPDTWTDSDCPPACIYKILLIKSGWPSNMLSSHLFSLNTYKLPSHQLLHFFHTCNLIAAFLHKKTVQAVTSSYKMRGQSWSSRLWSILSQLQHPFTFPSPLSTCRGWWLATRWRGQG